MTKRMKDRGRAHAVVGERPRGGRGERSEREDLSQKMLLLPLSLPKRMTWEDDDPQTADRHGH